MKKLLKIIAITIIIIFAGIYIFIIIPPGQTIIKNTVQTQLSKLTGQQVVVDKLNTNLFSYVRIDNFRIHAPSDSQNSLLSFQRLHVEYNLWTLFLKKIAINKIELEMPKIYIRRNAVGKFNLPDTFVSGQRDSSKEVIEENSGFAIQLNNVRIRKLSAEYTDLFDSLHVKLPEINASLSSATLMNSYSGVLEIDKGDLEWGVVHEKFSQLKVDYEIFSEKIKILSLVLKTDAINLSSSGIYNYKKQTVHEGKIDCVFNTDFLNKLLAQSAEDTLRNFAGKLNLRVNLEDNIQQPTGNASLTFAAGKLYNIPIENLNIDLKMENQQYSLSRFALNAFNGQLNGTGTVYIENELPHYDFRFSLNNFKLNKLLQDLYRLPTFEPRGQVSGKLSLKGAGTAWNEVTADGNLNITELFIQSQKFGDVWTNIKIDHGNISFGLKQNHSFITLLTSFQKDSTIKGQVEGFFSDIESIASISNLQNLNGQLKFKGQVQGSLKNPSAAIDFQFHDGQFKGIPISNVSGHAGFRDSVLTLSDIYASGESENLQVLTQYWPIDSLRGQLHYEITANGSLDQLQASAKLRWENCLFNTLALDSLKLDALYSGNEISIDHIALNKKDNQVLLYGKIDVQKNIVADVTVLVSTLDSVQNSSPAGKINITGSIQQNEINSVIAGENIRFAPLLTIASVPVDIDGELSFDSYVYGPLSSPNFNINWMICDIGFRENTLDSLNGKLSYSDKLVSIPGVIASHSEGNILISGYFPMDLYQAKLLTSPQPQINISADDFNLKFMQNFLADSISVAGKLLADLHLTGQLPHPEITGFLNINNANFSTPNFAPVDTVNMQTVFTGHQVVLQGFTGRLNNLAFSFQGQAELLKKNTYSALLNGTVSDFANIEFDASYSPNKEKTANIQISRLNLNSISKVQPLNFNLAGYVDMSLSYSDSSAAPEFTFMAKSDSLGIDRAVLDSLRIYAQTRDRDLILSESGFKINNGWVKLGGHVPFIPPGDSSAKLIQDIDFFAHAENMNINWIKPFLPSLETIQGVANYKIYLTGSATEPVINGFFFLQDGQVKIQNVETPIQSINIALQAENNEIKLDDFSGAVGGGTFKLKGQTHIVANEPTNSTLTLTLDKPEIYYPNIFKIGITNGNLTLTQNEKNLKLKGLINLSETKYMQDFKPKINEILTQIPNRPQQETTDFLDKILLDVNIQGQENIWVENNIAKIKLTSNINIFGTLAKPNISGRVAVNKGYVLYLDRKFKITEGLIDFTDPLRINPYINLTATCTVTDYQAIKETSYEITLKLSGLLEKPDFVLTSNPLLDKADIVAVLTVGRTRGTMFTSSEANKTTTFQELLVDRFKELTSRRIAGMTEQRIGRALSLESISIDGNLFQVDKNWGPKLTASKQLSDRINITYSTVVGHANEQQIKLGYKLYKSLSIIGNTGQTGQSGLDLKFNFKFY